MLFMSVGGSRPQACQQPAETTLWVPNERASLKLQCTVHGTQGKAVEAALSPPHACTHAHTMPSKGPEQTLSFLPASATRGSVACDSVVSLCLSPNRPPLFSGRLPQWYVFYKDTSLWIILRFFHIRSHIQALGFGGWGHPTYCAIRYYLACTAPPNLQAQT